MASYIKTLKEDNGDITYPQTLGSAVLLTGGADLETELAGKASAASVAGKIDIGDVQSSDIVSEAVTTAKIADGAVTADKIDWTTFGKASVAVLTASTGSFTATSKGILIIDSQFQASTTNTDAKATITFTGASGGTFSPRGAQYGAQYTRSHAFGFAFVEAGDEVDFTVNYTSASLPAWGADNGFALFLPCEW